jgi:predicted negative regulator of RcsB-dependent stress response
MNFWKSKAGIALTVAAVLAFGVASAWRIQSRTEHRDALQTQQRIERDVKQSINDATRDIKLCPLSDPDCNKR